MRCIAALLLALFGAAAHAQPITVDTPADLIADACDSNRAPCFGNDNGITGDVGDLPGPDGRISFREAIRAANVTPGSQQITFSTPANTLTVLQYGPLPPYQDSNAGIIGRSHTFRGTVVSSQFPGVPLQGLVITGDRNLIEGLVFNGFTNISAPPGTHGGTTTVPLPTPPGWQPTGSAGINIMGDHNTVRLCVSGMDAGGVVAIPNVVGFSLHGDNNDLGPDNTASGNIWYGIGIAGNRNKVHDANVGWKRVRNGLVGNQQSGIFIYGDHNLIGARSFFHRGPLYIKFGDPVLIGGNSINGRFAGVNIQAGNHNIVVDNPIGVDQARMVSMGNLGHGVLLQQGARNNTVIGNTISANRYAGIHINNAHENVIENNRIGTAVDGQTPLANEEYGIGIRNASIRNTVRDNVISANKLDGVSIKNADENRIRGNKIGLNAQGIDSVPNENSGVVIEDGRENLVGGPSGTLSPFSIIASIFGRGAQGNVISGNKHYGIVIRGARATENRIEGNMIGTNAVGDAIRRNEYSGIRLDDGANKNEIIKNLISGNGYHGVRISGTGTDENEFEENTIGLNKSQTAILRNEQAGVWIKDGSQKNVIGSLTPGKGNVISGNGRNGIVVEAADRNLFYGNIIGMNGAGDAPLENAYYGIWLRRGANHNEIGHDANVDTRNFISGNTLDGIRIQDSSDNKVYQSFIGLNKAGADAIENRRHGIQIDGGSERNIIGGLTGTNWISGNGFEGIYIHGATAVKNAVHNNVIGLDEAEQNKRPNQRNGILIEGARRTIIGWDIFHGNVISGNGENGIKVDRLAEDTLIHGNNIGLDTPGTAKFGNTHAGISVTGGARVTVIGSTGTNKENLIADNGKAGIHVDGTGGTDGTEIYGNKIGLDAAEAAAGNAEQGILIDNGATKTIIGNPSPANNVIGANTEQGILIRNAGTERVFIRGNRIGVNSAGNSRANRVGIQVEDGAKTVYIGGLRTSMGNTIAYNTEQGVRITDAGTQEVLLTRNSIFKNGALGIDVGPLNTDNLDARDIDAGPNGMMNSPTACVTQDPVSGATSLSLHLDTPNPQQATIELFNNTAFDPAGHGEGETYRGTVRPNAAGEFVIPDVSVAPWNFGPGSSITATATDNNNNTSEFSSAIRFDMMGFVTGAAAPLRTGRVGLLADSYGAPIAFGGNQYAVLRNGAAAADNYVDLDRDRFQIHIVDPALNTNPAATERHAGLVEIGTTDAAGNALDNMTACRLDEQGGVNSNVFHTPTHMLVADTLEDGSVPQDIRLGLPAGTMTVGAPDFNGGNYRTNDGLGNYPVDDAADDRTHLTMINGNVVATYHSPGGHACEITRPVCDRAGTLANIVTVTTHNFMEPFFDIGHPAPAPIFIAGAGNGRHDFVDTNGNGVFEPATETGEPFLDLSAGHTPPYDAGRRGLIWDPTVIASYIARAQERWTQACMNLVFAPTVNHEPAPGMWLDGNHNPIRDATGIPSQDSVLAQRFRSAVNLNAFPFDNVADVYFGPAIAGGGANAITINPWALTLFPGLPWHHQDAIFIGTDATANANHFTLAHELGHIILNTGHDPALVWDMWELYPTTPGSGSRLVHEYRRFDRVTELLSHVNRFGWLVR
ncbi:MAG TPA: right-handed parallel beta-helix repeat-containing protein [Gammaproteobacteria bacterium]